MQQESVGQRWKKGRGGSNKGGRSAGGVQGKQPTGTWEGSRGVGEWSEGVEAVGGAKFGWGAVLWQVLLGWLVGGWVGRLGCAAHLPRLPRIGKAPLLLLRERGAQERLPLGSRAIPRDIQGHAGLLAAAVHGRAVIGTRSAHRRQQLAHVALLVCGAGAQAERGQQVAHLCRGWAHAQASESGAGGGGHERLWRGGAPHLGGHKVSQAAHGRCDGDRAIAHGRLRYQPAGLEPRGHQHKVTRAHQHVGQLLCGSNSTIVDSKRESACRMQYRAELVMRPRSLGWVPPPPLPLHTNT